MKSVIRLAIALIAILMWSSCSDEEYTTKSTVFGIITDTETNTRIEGATVTNETTGKNVVTKDDGYYEFQGLSFGEEYTIAVQKNGYKPTNKHIVPSEVRDRIECNIAITKLP